MYVMHTDDSIVMALSPQEAEGAIRDIRAAGLNNTVEGDLQDFLEVSIQRESNRAMRLNQSHLER